MPSGLGWRDRPDVCPASFTKIPSFGVKDYGLSGPPLEARRGPCPTCGKDIHRSTTGIVSQHLRRADG